MSLLDKKGGKKLGKKKTANNSKQMFDCNA